VACPVARRVVAQAAGQAAPFQGGVGSRGAQKVAHQAAGREVDRVVHAQRWGGNHVACPAARRVVAQAAGQAAPFQGGTAAPLAAGPEVGQEGVAVSRIQSQGVDRSWLPQQRDLMSQLPSPLARWRAMPCQLRRRWRSPYRQPPCERRGWRQGRKVLPRLEHSPPSASSTECASSRRHSSPKSTCARRAPSQTSSPRAVWYRPPPPDWSPSELAPAARPSAAAVVPPAAAAGRLQRRRQLALAPAPPLAALRTSDLARHEKYRRRPLAC
jgi:hypothetical protein